MSDLKTDDGIVVTDEERTKCEVWTRVMGYHRPVHAFNIGKKGEFAERVAFSEHPAGCGCGVKNADKTDMH